MITPDDVRRLLGADSDAVLVLIEGRTEVVGQAPWTPTTTAGGHYR